MGKAMHRGEEGGGQEGGGYRLGWGEVEWDVDEKRNV